MSIVRKRVARIHNYYQQSGGEDQTLATEVALLRAHGHKVEVFSRCNSQIPENGLIGKSGLAVRAVWNASSRKEVRDFLRARSIDIAHFHNTMPLLSPAAYYGAADLGVPIVQTIHNYRTFCPAATLFRNGAICEKCVGKGFALPAVLHACYRNDRFATVTQAVTNTIHQTLGTYRSVIDAYICMTEFSRQKAIEGGIPSDRIFIKPHFVYPDPGIGSGAGRFAVYVGRLAPEKGLRTLLKAWCLARMNLKLSIVGDGPDRDLVRHACAENASIHWVGHLPYAQVLDLIGSARFLIFPSEWYETFGRVIIEAFARGTPVIASDIGGHPELVTDGENGMLFRAGDAQDLAEKISQFENPEMAQLLRVGARRSYEEHYAAESNYLCLIEIYERAHGGRAPLNASRYSGKSAAHVAASKDLANLR